MLDHSIPELGNQHRAVLLKSTKLPYDISIVQKQRHVVTPGSAIIRVLRVPILTYAGKVYSGRNPYPYPEPFVPGSSAIGRIVSVGNDATTLRSGHLVFFDCFIRSRDDMNSRILSGLWSGFDVQSNQLMAGEWRDSTFAEFAKVPLENCYRLDEERLLGSPSIRGLGYSMDDLTYLLFTSIAIGGLRSIDLRAGEKVIITPATGSFGSAAVKVALAMGAQVIAMGRNEEHLKKLESVSRFSSRLTTVVNTGDVEADLESLTESGPVDVFFDISPGEAAKSSHFKSCMMALRHGGRASLMGFTEELVLPMTFLMLRRITLRPMFMYEKDDINYMIKLVERGFLKIGQVNGVETVGVFPLEEFEAAFECAANQSGPFQQTIIAP